MVKLATEERELKQKYARLKAAMSGAGGERDGAGVGAGGGAGPGPSASAPASGRPAPGVAKPLDAKAAQSKIENAKRVLQAAKPAQGVRSTALKKAKRRRPVSSDAAAAPAPAAAAPAAAREAPVPSAPTVYMPESSALGNQGAMGGGAGAGDDNDDDDPLSKLKVQRAKPGEGASAAMHSLSDNSAPGAAPVPKAPVMGKAAPTVEAAAAEGEEQPIRPPKRRSDLDGANELRTIFVGNCPVTPGELREVFGAYGAIEEIRQIPGKTFSFIKYVSYEDARSAIDNTNGRNLFGWRVRTAYAKASEALNRSLPSGEQHIDPMARGAPRQRTFEAHMAPPPDVGGAPLEEEHVEEEDTAQRHVVTYEDWL